ncbi:25195_t:CDS:2 [Cetraspora pellucida]|uniref:25195_t:CDS:1 n=1 Tax=Cetraspora pellucida TaxID=1433469 RepID=A0A9N9EEC2_9GLOM|nr:25195_t:CDS:2 [Cetraspora pellucida]
MDSPFLCYFLSKDNATFLYQYHFSYKNSLVGKIQSNSFEDDEEEENYSYEDFNNEEFKVKTEIQSTQCAENSNKIIKAKLSWSSQLVDVIDEF